MLPSNTHAAPSLSSLRVPHGDTPKEPYKFLPLSFMFAASAVSLPLHFVRLRPGHGVLLPPHDVPPPTP